MGSSVINEIAVAIENERALCPLGIPPLNGVPSPKIDFIIKVAKTTNTNAINII